MVMFSDDNSDNSGNDNGDNYVVMIGVIIRFV